MTALPLELDPRRIFTVKQCAEIFENYKGRCALCGKKLFKRSEWIAGHIKAHGLGGKTVVENGRPECLDCAKETQNTDTGICLKADKQGGRRGQYARRQRNGSQIQSRGFEQNLTRGFNGKVRKRKKRKVK